MENYLGKAIDEATFSSPIKIIGWDELPQVGEAFEVFEGREAARAAVAAEKERRSKKSGGAETQSENVALIPLVVKADTGSSLEAVISEIKKQATEKIAGRVISSGIGSISESDVKLADGTEKAVIVGFNVKVDAPAKSLAERSEIEIRQFDIIYKMNEWLAEILANRTPKEKTVEVQGRAKVLKVFSKVRDRQILGARAEKGALSVGSEVRILRRETEIGKGSIRELQKQKNETREVLEGQEFGAMIVSPIEIAPGDHIESFIIVEK
jgi:translation initiation factor IF-2